MNWCKQSGMSASSPADMGRHIQSSEIPVGNVNVPWPNSQVDASRHNFANPELVRTCKKDGAKISRQSARKFTQVAKSRMRLTCNLCRSTCTAW